MSKSRTRRRGHAPVFPLIWLVCLAVATAFTGPRLLAQSTPTSAVVTEWDIFAATGGDGGASQNILGVLLDASGIAGPGGAVWTTSQYPLVRLGRLDPSASGSNYVEWRPVTSSEGGGTPFGLALNRGNGDVWLTMQGHPSFMMKVANSNTFRKFRTTYALIPAGIATASDNSAIAALPGKNFAGIGNAVMKIPRDPASGYVTATYWPVNGEPRHVALDSAGRIWFTEFSANRIGRLDPGTGVVNEWALPTGTGPVGLQMSGSTVCVASQGSAGALTGVVHCLDTGTNAFTRYARVTGDGFDYPQHVSLNSDGEVFVTEQNGSSVGFIAYANRATATVTTVTPTTRTVLPKTTRLTVTDTTVTPASYTISPTQTTLAGSDNGYGIVRFQLPSVSLTYPSPDTGHPQPVGVTSVLNDQGRGTGTVFIGEYFNGPIWGRRAAGRLARVQLTTASSPEPVIQTNPSSLEFTAVSGSAAPGSQSIGITEASAGSLSWTAAKSAAWLTLESASGSAPSSLTVSIDHTGLSAGTYTDTITIDDGVGGATAKTVTVTLNVTSPATIAVSPASMTFAASAGATAPPNQTISITNTGGGILDWTATATEAWIIVYPSSGTAPSNVTVGVDSSTLSAGSYSGTITIAAAGATNSPRTVSVSLTVSNATPTISLSPATLSFSATRLGANPASQTVSITNSGGGTLAWTASPSATWLSVSPSSGTAPATVTVAADITGLDAGTYNGTVTVAGTDASNSPQTIPVTLTVNAIPRSIVLSPTTLSFTATRNGANPANQTISLTNGGDGTLSWTASDDQSWLTVTGASGSGNATLTASVDITGLAAGTYNGTITVTDSGASNSPQTVAVTLTVNPIQRSIVLSPSSLSFTAIRETNPANQTISLTNGGDDTLSWTASSNQSWLTVSPSSGTGNATLTASVNVSGLTAGSYSATITVTDAGASNSPQTVAVTLTVNPIPRSIVLNPTSLSFSATRAGANPASQTVALTNGGDGTLSWTAASNQTWLTVSPTSGSGNATLTASIDITGLAAGTHNATITVTDAEASNSPQTVAVTLTVNPISRSIVLNPTTLSFSATRLGPNPANQTIALSNGGDGDLSWTASSNQSWLTVSPGSGTGNATLTASVNTSGLTAGTHNATITVTDAGATNSPQTVAVTLTLAPAQRSIVLSPTSLSFSATRLGPNPANQTISLTNGGDDTLSWTASSNSAWLLVSPASGTGNATLTASVDVTGLTAGTYNGIITVTDAGASNSPQTVAVTLTVTPIPRSIVLNPATLSFSATRLGPNPANQTIALTNGGDGDLSWTASSNQSWLTVSPASGTGNATLTASVNTTGLTAGTHTATITVTDAGATNSPQTVSVALTLAPAQRSIVLSPTSLSFSATRLGPNPSNQSISLTNGGDDTLSWAASSNQPWLLVSPTSGTGNGTLTASVDVTGLAAGTYNATITVADAGASNSPQTVPVTLTVAPIPRSIVLDPTTLSFSATRLGPNPANQTIALTNGGDGELSWTASSNQSWLSVSPTGGTGNATLTASVDITGLSAGTYNGTITIADAGATNSPQTVSVTLTVNAIARSIVLNPTTLSFSATRLGPNPANQTIALTNGGDGTLSWTASSNQSWLAVSPASGTGDATLTASVDITGLAAGTYNGTIAVTDGGASNSPQTVAVTLTVAPKQNSIAPSPSSLTFTAKRTTNPATQTVAVNNTGDGTLAWTASVSTQSGGSWLAVSPSSGGNGTVVTVTVTSSSLPPGTYSGTLTITDASADNSPVQVPVTLTVTAAPTIGLSSVSLSFTAKHLGSIPSNQTVTLSNTGDATLTYTAGATSSGWLSVSPGSGSVAASGNTTLTISVDNTGLTPGTYTGSIAISDSSATNSPQTINVTHVVTAAPRIAVDQASMSFSSARLTVCNGVTGGANPANQTLALSNTGSATLNYAISSSASWLSVSPVSGSVATSGSTNLTVSIDLTGLTAGTYNGAITITDANASNSPQTVSVTLTVTAAAPRLCVTTATGGLTLALGNISKNTTVTGDIFITNAGDGTLTWASTTPTSVFRHTISRMPTSGTAPTTVVFSVKPANNSTTGSYSTTFDITGSDGTTVTVTVTWTTV